MSPVLAGRFLTPAPPGNLPDPGIEPMSLMSLALAGSFFTTSANREAPVESLKPSVYM